MIKSNLLSVPGLRKFDPGTDKNKRWCVYFLMHNDEIVRIGKGYSLRSISKMFKAGVLKDKVEHDEIFMFCVSESKIEATFLKFADWYNAAKIDPYALPSDFGL